MPITLDDLRSAYLKAWSARIYLDGFRYVGVDTLPSRTIGFLQPRSTASMTIQEFPSPGTGRPAFVDIVLDGTKSERFFTGSIDPKSVNSSSETNTVHLVDLLGALDTAFTSDLTWTGRSFPDAVVDLLERAGLSADDVDEIFDPGLTLGSVYSIKITKDETVSQVMADLMAYGGAAIYITPTGRIRVVDAPGIPSETSSIVYARGADLAAGEFGIFDADITVEGNESIVNRVTVTGPKRPDGAIPDGTFTATGINGRPETLSMRFLQMDSDGQTIAERELTRRARARTNLRISAPLNPLILPGDTILFRDEKCGYPDNTGALVTEIATAGTEMTMQVSLGPSLIEGNASSIQPPTVDFAMTIENQLITLLGVVSGRYFVQCTDQSKDKNGFELTGRSWSATGPDVSPASSSDPNPLFFFSDLTGAEITLEVTSASGESGTVTKKPKATQTIVFTRSISAAAGANGWRILASLEGWRVFDDASCTAVPGINDQGPLIAGFSNGAIYKSDDRLLTAPTLLTTLADGIACLSVNEGDPNQILAGAGTAIYRSLDGGVSWTAIIDFSTTDVYDVASSPVAPNEVRACTGNLLKISYDAATFTTLLAGPVGTQAAMMAAAPWGHAVVFAGVDDVADAIQFEEGHAVDWSGVAELDRPVDLTAITPLFDREGFIVADGGINDLVRDGALNAMVYGAASGSGRLWLLLWNGTQFVASLLTTAADGKTFKLTNQTGAYPIDSVASLQVGYGDIVLPPPPPEIVVYNATYLYHIQADYTVVQRAMPASGQTWRGIAIHPVNPTRWLLWCDDGGDPRPHYPRLFYTATSGQTWIEVVLPDVGGDGWQDRVQILDAVFSGVGAEWLIVVYVEHRFGEYRRNFIRGSAGTVSEMHSTGTYSDNPTMIPITSLTMGIGQAFGATGSDWYTIPTSATPVPAHVAASGFSAESLVRAGNPAALGIQSSNVGYTPDYATTAPTAAVSAGTSLASCESGVYVGGRSGIMRITDIDNEAIATSIVAAADLSVGRIATGGLRKAVATRRLTSPYTIFAFTGDTWVTIDAPGSGLYDDIGVIERQS